MLFERDDFKNVLDCCVYSRLGNVISKFLELKPDMLNFGIKFTLSTSQRSI